MTSSQIQTLIDGVSNGGLNTAAEARAIWEALKNEIYGEQKVDTNATTEVLTLVESNALYTLTFTRYGNKVHVFGVLRKNSGSVAANSTIANFTNADFAPKTGQKFRIVGFFDGDNTNVPFSFENISTPRIKNIKTMPSTYEYYINGWYLTD